MDSIDKRIEEYKQELLKYAQINKAFYHENNSGFQTVKNKTQPESTANKKVYDERFICNRPMPCEYLANDDNNETVNTNSTPQHENKTNLIEKQTYKNYDEFISKNTKSGKLRVQTYASTQVFPIQNARVIVEKDFDDGTYIFKEDYTDIDGVADNIILPAKSKSLSLSPDMPIPYSTYTIKVTHPQFSPITFKNVPIFESIESMQPVAMLPLNTPQPLDEIYEEEPDL